MVFFNYSTMQMAAKVVYYGPGLGGKTTNLQHIYAHTSTGSRGEMVSLETDSDRTLFFDLLPLDIGNIQGFKTRIQLYTVPGQVFYNTTRKLVLKSVDGVVFVADSQRPMLNANLESFQNLEENLAEIGLTVDDVPLVLQYNKRDLKNVLSVEELERDLNRGNWPSFEAAAIHGHGVFETLKAISKMTLVSLKKRLALGAPAPGVRKPAAARPSMPAAPSPQSPPPAPPPAPSQAAPPRFAAPPPSEGRSADILAELEKIRHETTSRQAPAKQNGRRRIDQNLRFLLARADLRKAHRLSLNLEIEDADRRVVERFTDAIDVEDPAGLEQLLLRLQIALSPRD
jgi:signal recognition particle receptor subunit beta